jgi:hypothetical protein
LHVQNIYVMRNVTPETSTTVSTWPVHPIYMMK